MDTYSLSIKFDNDNIKQKYIQYYDKRYIDGVINHTDDSGFDLFVPCDYTFRLNETKLIDFQVSCAMLSHVNNNYVGYYLYPRSSIYKNDMIMMNSTGIIDSGYRGHIKAPLKWLGNHETNPSDTFTLEGGTRICQICSSCRWR